MERRAGSGPLGFSERSSTVKEYETLTREKVDVVPFGCGMPETHLMQDWSDRMLDLILNGPTINGIKKDEVRAMLRETYTALKQYEKIGPMASPFINDPTAIVARAFSELYPGVEYVAQYVPDLRDETNGTAYGLTIFPDDGSTPIVCISAEAPISAALSCWRTSWPTSPPRMTRSTARAGAQRRRPYSRSTTSSSTP